MPIISPTAISPHRIGGKSWSAYWEKQIEAKAFADAAGITDETQQRALAQFVIDLKAINDVDAGFVDFETPANSILLACYPFVGGSATTHKFNLINPADTDAAFRVTFAGGLTHSAAGVKSDGSAGTYGATHLSTALLGETSHGVDISTRGSGESGIAWSLINGGDPYIYVAGVGNIARNTAVQQGVTLYTNGQEITTVDNKFNSSMLININRLSNGAGGANAWIGGLKRVSGDAIAGVRHVSDIRLFSFGNNVTKGYVDYVGIRSAGISDAAMLLYITAIWRFQNTLGRLSKTNLHFQGHSFFTSITGGNPYDWMVEKTVLLLNNSYNTGILSYSGGGAGGAKVSDLIGNKATNVDPFYKDKFGIKNIIPIWIGTNDITNTPGCGATTYASLKSYYNSLVADGWTPIVFTMTEYSGGAGQQEAERVIYNNLIRTDLGCPHLIDCDTYPELTDSTNTTYFKVDQVHLTAAGNQVAADALVAMIATI